MLVADKIVPILPIVSGKLLDGCGGGRKVAQLVLHRSNQARAKWRWWRHIAGELKAACVELRDWCNEGPSCLVELVHWLGIDWKGREVWLGQVGTVVWC